MNSQNQVILEISGPRITADKFSRGVRAFFDFIDELAREVSGKIKPVQWIVSAQEGSIKLIAKPEPEEASPDAISSVLKAIENGVKMIEGSASRPECFSDKVLKDLQKLASICDGNGDLDRVRIWVNQSPNEISTKIASNVNSILGIHFSDLGAIEGRLQMISERGGLRFAVYDSLTDRRVRCYFDEDLLEKIIFAFGKRVNVYGMIRYRQDGEPITISVEDFKVLRPRNELPTPEEVRGILRE